MAAGVTQTVTQLVQADVKRIQDSYKPKTDGQEGRAIIASTALNALSDAQKTKIVDFIVLATEQKGTDISSKNPIVESLNETVQASASSSATVTLRDLIITQFNAIKGNDSDSAITEINPAGASSSSAATTLSISLEMLEVFGASVKGTNGSAENVLLGKAQVSQENSATEVETLSVDQKAKLDMAPTAGMDVHTLAAIPENAA
jgi:hypothetical protein